jgi:hypothetical protein
LAFIVAANRQWNKNMNGLKLSDNLKTRATPSEWTNTKIGIFHFLAQTMWVVRKSWAILYCIFEVCEFFKNFVIPHKL